MGLGDRQATLGDWGAMHIFVTLSRVRIPEFTIMGRDQACAAQSSSDDRRNGWR